MDQSDLHVGVAMSCITHLRNKDNDGSDNLMFIGLLNKALAAASCTLADLPLHPPVTPDEITRHEEKGYFASAKYILGILRSSERRDKKVLIEHMLDDLKKARSTLKKLGTSIHELEHLIL